jgi:hypothetical protein
MTPSEIIGHRLINQQIAETTLKKPEEVVSWLGAVQAQEYAMAKWAIGLRLPVNKNGSPAFNDTDIETAFNEGTILRTHAMRPTWHFVSPADIRWIQELTASRVHAISAYYARQRNLNAKVFKKSNDTLIKVLEGGKHLTRTELKTEFERVKIFTDGERLAHLLMYAELERVICSGPRKGKQFTYALLDERAPANKKTKKFNREEALAELIMRYFKSRGPATIQDFVWWSGLTVKDARTGISLLTKTLESKIINGQEYFFYPGELKDIRKLQTTFLMPDYDEYGISYKNRDLIFDKKNALKGHDGNPIFGHMIVINGVIEGTWQRVIKNNKVNVETTFFSPLNKTKTASLNKAIKKYISFVS